MDPRYKNLVVGLVPQPREVPPPPFSAEHLQSVFSEVGNTFPYQSFEFVFNRRGAKFSNSEDDWVEFRPAEFQISAKMDGEDVLTREMAESKAVRILETGADQLRVPGFLQCAVRIIAVVPVPEQIPDAKDFLAERLMGGANVAALGEGYFGATVGFKKLNEDPPGQDELTVEPYFQDTNFVFVDHQITRTEGGQLLRGFEQIHELIDEAFQFVEGPVIHLLDKDA